MRSIAALCSLFILSCAHGRSGSGTAPAASEFPTQAELDKLETNPPLKQRTPDDVVQLDAWKAVGALPNTLSEDPFTPTSELDRGLWSRASARAADSRQSLACAAREIGAIYLKHGKFPGQLLEDHIFARCGVTAAHTHSRSLTGEVSDKTANAELVQHWGDDIQKALAQLPSGEQFGYFLGREKGKAIYLQIAGTPEADFERVALTPSDGKLVIRGKLRVQAEKLRAEANLGSWDAVECERLGGVTLPDFAFSCPLDKSDVLARVEIHRWEEGRVLGHQVADFFALPSGAAGDSWTKPAFTAARGDTAQARFINAVNSLRERASRPPVTDAPAQAASAVRLLPHYLAAIEEGGDPRDADRIVLGLMAGWHVPEQKVDGDFHSSWSTEGDEAGLAAAMITRPNGRRTLLEPKTSKLAAAIQPYGRGSFGIVTSYRLHQRFTDFEDAATAFFNALDGARKKRGKSPSNWLRLSAEVEKEAHESLEKGSWPEVVRDRLMSTAVEVGRRSLVGWILQGPSYGEIYLPDKMLDAPNLDLVVVAGDSQAGGHPWVQATVVVLVLHSKEETQSASLEPR